MTLRSVPETSIHDLGTTGLAEGLREASIDHDAFSTPLRPCELSACRATCCHDGVQLSETEASTLAKLLTQHRRHFLAYGIETNPDSAFAAGSTRDAAAKTATRSAAPEELAADYPSHFPRTRCVFLDTESRCAWQRLAVDLGQPPWFYKPLTCWMHPILLLAGRSGERPVLTLARPGADPQQRPGYPGFASCTHCGRPDPHGQPALEVLSAELHHLGLISGRDLLAELRAPSSGFTRSANASPSDEAPPTA